MEQGLLHKYNKKTRVIWPKGNSLLGGIRLSGRCFFGGFLFLCKKSFYVFLCPDQFLHLISCLAVVRVGSFLFCQQLCELRSPGIVPPFKFMVNKKASGLFRTLAFGFPLSSFTLLSCKAFSAPLNFCGGSCKDYTTFATQAV